MSRSHPGATAAGPDLIREIEEAAAEYGLGLTEAAPGPLCVRICA
jgi:hypothetical protein